MLGSRHYGCKQEEPLAKTNGARYLGFPGISARKDDPRIGKGSAAFRLQKRLEGPQGLCMRSVVCPIT